MEKIVDSDDAQSSPAVQLVSMGRFLVGLTLVLVPFISVVLLQLLYFAYPAIFLKLLHKENSLVNVGSVVCWVGGLVTLAYLMLKRGSEAVRAQPGGFFALVTLVLLGLLEEIDWGARVFGASLLAPLANRLGVSEGSIHSIIEQGFHFDITFYLIISVPLLVLVVWPACERFFGWAPKPLERRLVISCCVVMSFLYLPARTLPLRELAELHFALVVWILLCWQTICLSGEQELSNLVWLMVGISVLLSISISRREYTLHLFEDQQIVRSKVTRAVRKGHSEELAQLLVHGGVDLREGGEVPPVLRALQRYEQSQVVSVLARHHAPLSRTDEHGQSIFIRAAKKNKRKLVRELVAVSPALMDRRDNLGRTALWWAAHLGDLATLKLLLKLGADPCVQEFSGRSALSEARRKQYKAIIALLQESTAGLCKS